MCECVCPCPSWVICNLGAREGPGKDSGVRSGLGAPELRQAVALGERGGWVTLKRGFKPGSGLS